MRTGGREAGFDYPQGDPGAVEAAAGALAAAAGQLSTAAGQVSREGAAVGAGWCGPAALAFEDAVGSVGGGLDALAGHQRHAAAALTTYAGALREAQAAAQGAALAYSEAQGSYNTTMSNLSGHPAPGPGAQVALARAEGRALDGLNAAFSSAATASSHASAAATNAARVCAAQLTQISDDMRETALHKFLDLMGGPSTVLGGLGVALQAKSLLAFGSLVRAMETGNWDVVDAADAKGYQEVLEAVERYGPKSIQATNVWMKYESDVSRDAFADTVDAAVPAGEVPGGLAGVLDVIGKVGFVAAIAGDGMTLADGQSTGMEKTMAGANLGGVALAAGGITLDAAAGTTVLGALGVTGAALTVVPVVGEVVIAGTAVYFAYDWTSHHWQDIVNWTHDAGKGISTAYHAVVNLPSDTINEGEHLVSSGLHEANHLVSGAVHEGGQLLSDLNPF